ncbi:MAG: hypothetical protein U0807_02745 [Candidatus Binatia bacterium]
MELRVNRMIAFTIVFTFLTVMIMRETANGLRQMAREAGLPTPVVVAQN